MVTREDIEWMQWSEHGAAGIHMLEDDGLPDSPYSVPGRAGTPEQIRMAMSEVGRGLRRVEEDEAREAGAMGRMGKP